MPPANASSGPAPEGPEAFRALLRRAHQGDEEARAEIHRRFEGPLEAFVRSIVGPGFLRHSSVDEVCQETLLRCFSDLAELPDDATPEVFRNRLFRNARWIVHRLVERSRDFVGESAVTPQPDEGASPDPAEIPHSQTGAVTRRDELAHVERLVSRLRPAYAEVIRLRTSGLDFAQVAARLGCREEAARKRYSRAVEQLQQLLSERGDRP